MIDEDLGYVDGYSILSGAGVPSGSLGVDGDSYLNSTNGDIYSKSGGAWGSPTGNIKGIQGVQGFSILSGAVAPTTQGVNGDTYLNTTNGDVYLKSGGVWALNGNIKGVKGDKAVMNSTSITSNVIGTGTKTFTLVTPVDLVIGQVAKAYSLADPTNYVLGYITNISPTSIEINVSEIGGTGTKTDWVITLAAFKGTTGITTPNLANGTIAGRYSSGTGSAEQVTPIGFFMGSDGKFYNARAGTSSGLQLGIINNPIGGELLAWGTSVTGAIRVKLPSNASSTTVLIKGSIFNLGTFTIGIYPSSMGFSYNAFFNGGISFPVRWYTDGTNRYVYIGDLTTVWAYTAITIDSVQIALTDVTIYASGWIMSFETAFTGTLNATRTASQTLPNSNSNQIEVDYNAASGVDTALTNAMSRLQMFQNLQKQILSRIVNTGSALNLILGNGTYQALSTLAAFTATKLLTARNINGVAFDGTTNITIADSTKEPTANKSITLTSPDDIKFPTTKAVSDALALKADIAAATGTLVALTFTSDSVQGTIASPLTGNITGNITGAKLGVVTLVIHNHTTAPTFDAKYKKLSGSGSYVTGSINYIFCEYINATEIIYSINQRT